jgi:predicted secreted Zn-dependent protease
MGRTIPTYRLHLESILNDWMDYRRALREKDREIFDRLLNRARQHTSAASYSAHLDPTDLAFLSILLEMERELETLRARRECSSALEDSAPCEPPGGTG